jgi:hypothetical protein
LTGVVRNGTPERAAQCRAAARLGGFHSGVTRRRRSRLRTPSKRFRVRYRGRKPAPQAPFFCPPENASASTPKDQVQDQDLKILKAGAEPAPVRTGRANKERTADPFRNPVKTLRAIAYRGLEHGIDLGLVREHLKRTFYRVFPDAPLTSRDVGLLDSLLLQAEQHRRKMGERYRAVRTGSNSAAMSQPQVTAGAASDRRRPQEEPMPSPFFEDDDANEYVDRDDAEMARLERLMAAERAARAAAVPAPAPTPPKPYTPPATDPPKNFRQLVEARRRQLAGEE